MAAKGSHRLVFLGDSITQNWEKAGRRVWEQYYMDRAPLNLGIASDKTQHVLWRVLNTEFGKQQPELVVVLVGTNNSAEYTADEIAAGVASIIEALRKQTPESKVLLLAIFPRGEALQDPRREVNDAANGLLSELAEKQGVEFLDISHKFTHDDGSTNLDLMPDALHLNAVGYAVWAEAMEPSLTELIAE